MGLGKDKRILKKDEEGNYKFFGSYNGSSSENASHKVDVPTNFNLPAITLEDIDQAVYGEFNNRFTALERTLALYSGDAETSSLPMMNWQDFDPQKGFLTWPFFVYTRTETKKLYRTSPAFKQVLFTVPKKKPQGIVYEEYISEGPVSYELVYDFKFISYFREECNQMEEQINHYFRNKRNIITLYSERFTVSPLSQDQICSIDIVSRDDPAQTTMYVVTIKMKLWCHTRRGVKDMQKRERPNSYTLNMTVSDHLGKKTIISKDTINIEKVVIDNKTKPTTRLLDQ